MSLAVLLTILTGPWATAIASVLLALTSGVVIYGETDDSWVSWLPRVTTAFSLLVLGANVLHALGWLS